MDIHIELAPDARENGLAVMLSDLVRQNLEAKPHKLRDFAALSGTAAIVADDADVALTLSFEAGGKLTILDGVAAVPDLTIRGSSEIIMALSNLPLDTRFGLPVAGGRDESAKRALHDVLSAFRAGTLHIYGLALHPLLALKLTRVMSIHG